MIAAILRAQALSMRMGKRRGAALSAVMAALWYGMWSMISCAVFLVAFAAQPAALRAYAPLGFLAIFLYWQVVPIVTASMGSSLDTRKLLVYPIPHRQLFLVEVLLRLTSSGEMVMVLGAGVAGRGGRGAAVPGVQPAAGIRRAEPAGAPALAAQGA